MRSLIVNKDGSMEIKEINKPKYGPKQALTKMIACGMCGSDVKLIHKCFKGVPESIYPVILGHEGIGEVVEIGAEVKSLKVGDKVMIPYIDDDAENFGDLRSAWGAVSEYAVVNDAAAFPEGTAPGLAYAQTLLADDIDPVDAVIIVTFREVLAAIQYFGIKPEDSVAVFGCGPVGLTYIKILNLLGVKDLIAVDIVDDKLKSATENGATLTINSRTSDLTAAVRAKYPNGIHHVIDAVGLPIVTNQALTILKDRGNVLVYGVLEKEEITIDFSKASYNWNFICQQMPEKKEEYDAHDQIVEWIRSGKLVMKDYISDYFPFEDSVKAYELLLDLKIMKKGIITF